MWKIAVLLSCAGAVFVQAANYRPQVQSSGHDESYPPIPYQFSYSSTDQEGTHSHEESGDGAGNVNGKYTLQLSDGRSRVVKYVADAQGYRAEIVTNELGTESKNPADVVIQSSAPTGPEAALAAGPAAAGGILSTASGGFKRPYKA